MNLTPFGLVYIAGSRTTALFSPSRDSSLVETI